MIKIGQGFDVHAFAATSVLEGFQDAARSGSGEDESTRQKHHNLKDKGHRPLIIGGVTIPHPVGLEGHSDADVLLHAISDALLGAATLGDLGTHFPDTDPAYYNVSSRVLLRVIREQIDALHFTIAHLDSTVIAQVPRLLPYIKVMREIIAEDLNIAMECVSIKAKTTEHLGCIGRQEGIAAFATVLLTKNSN